MVFDPLDGSRNIECNIPVGTIFGIYEFSEDLGERSVMRPGRGAVTHTHIL